MNRPYQLITEKCHADDRKNQLNFSETTNDESGLIFPYWNHQRQTTLISGEKTMQADKTTHSTLTPGSKNNDVNEVKYLQEQLNIFYHSYIIVDGDFGNITEEYVKKFQTDCCLKVDGIVGSQTWSYIDAIVPYSNKMHSTLSQSKTNNPSEVKYLQARLNQAKRQGKSGTTVIAVNGNFDSQTETRVKQFQSDFHLTADGIVGNKTWTVLEDAVLKS